MLYLDIKGIKQAFANHMIKYRGYSEEEAAIAVSDFPDPFNNCYLVEDYLGDCEIDGVVYKKYACHTAFWKIGLKDVPMFKFYIYYRKEDIPNHTVGEYMNARKLYQTDELAANDFPKDAVKKRELDFTVTLCLGGGDGGDVCVSVDVSDEEYELLKECYRECWDCEIDGFPGLEDLYEQIKEEVQGENDFCMMDCDSEEEIEYDNVSFIIQMPSEIIDEVDAEDDADE